MWDFHFDSMKSVEALAAVNLHDLMFCLPKSSVLISSTGSAGETEALLVAAMMQ